MNRERWQRIEEAFHGAIDRPASEREAFVEEACGGDAALCDEVIAMLRDADADPGFLSPLVNLSESVPAPAGGTVERIGPYRVVREIGAGGMGVVYLAIHEGEGFERPVALKVIRRGLDTGDLLRRFQLERRILASLQHANIARLTDAGQTADGRPFLVMDFVEGEPIDVFADRAQLDIAGRLRLFQSVCGAVQHAHANLVVHRDIKPANVLVRPDGEPVLLDFGIGKLLDLPESQPASSTQTGARAFTPEYAAPEQIRGEPASTRTDVYGLGLLLYRVLTGRRPFDAASGFEYEEQVLKSEPPKPSTHGARALAGDLDTIILKALRKEPERRYASVAALSDDVQRHLDGLPVRARGDSFGYVAGKFVRRHRLALGAAAVVFMSLVAATTYSAVQARAVARERDKARAVQSFLLEMFGASGGRNDSMSVRQLLDAQTQVVPIAYASDAELRAQMLSVVAEGYDRLGALAPAESLARASLALSQSSLAPGSPEIAAATGFLGWVLHERGKSKEGEALLREALAMWPRARPANPGLHARALNDLGVIREASGAYAEADTLYRQSLAMRRKIGGSADLGVAVTGSNLSVILYRTGDFEGAVVEAESALAVMRRRVGPDHQRSTLIQGNLAAFRVGMGDLNGAEAEYRQLVERQTRVQGRGSPVTLGVMNGLATVLRNQGKYAAAESLSIETVAGLEAAFGKEHARVANAVTILGTIYSLQRRHREARPLLERSLAIQRKLRGNVHRDVAIALGTLGALHGDAGDWAAAERVLREAVDVFEKSVGAQHVETATARVRLARAVYARGGAAEALPMFQQAHDALVAAGVKPETGTFKEVRLRMAHALIALDRRREADSVVALVASPDSAHRALMDSLKRQGPGVRE